VSPRTLLSRRREADPSPAGLQAPRTGLARLLNREGRFVTIWIATIVLFVASGLAVPGSLDGRTLKSLLPFAGALMIASAGQFMVIQAGGLDLSVPGVIGLTAMIVTRYPHIGALWISIVVAIIAAAVAGLLNGLIVVYLRFSPIVATLAVNALLIGIVLQFTGGFAYVAPARLTRDISARPLGIPFVLLVAVILIAVLALILRQTTVGRRLVAVGVNRRAAAAAGFRVNRYAISSYAIGAACYGVVGVLLAGLLNIPGLAVGGPYLILTFAAVVLGGSPLLGGQGSVIATGVGALFLTQLDQVVLDAGGNTATQYLVQGSVIAASLVLGAVSWRRLLHWHRQPQVQPPALAQALQPPPPET
jgi:ribose transport system permease protein